MKKILFTTVAAAALSLGALSSFAQGNIAFQNQVATALTNSAGAKLVAPAGTYEFGLYVGAAGSQASALTLVATGLNAVWNTGIINDGLISFGNPLTLATNAAGTLIAFQVRGWTANLGSSYEAALANTAQQAIDGAAALAGTSILGSVTPTAPPNGAGQLFGNTGGGLAPAFGLLPIVPEPSTFALGALGVGALALIRRRK